MTKPYFWGAWWLHDQTYLRDCVNKLIPASALSTIPCAIARRIRLARSVVSNAYTDYALSRYVQWLPQHYGPQGRGYVTAKNLTDEEKRARFSGQEGRLAQVLTHSAIPYRDGDSFLDAGCGTGQNIKVLRDRFPESYIEGFDISDDALDVVRANDPYEYDTRVWNGSLTDLGHLRLLKDGSADHIVMSHVFSLLMADNMDKTVRLRQSIIDELVRIASKSVLLLDGSILRRGRPVFNMEQKWRGSVLDFAPTYFNPHYGELTVLIRGPHEAVLFVKEKA